MRPIASYFHASPAKRLPPDGLPVVVSFPKAGRTWLNVLLDELGIPAHYTHDRTDHSKHEHFRALNPNKRPYANRKVVFLARDPRDTAVSGYFWTTKRRGLFQGTMSEFLRDPHHGIPKICRFYAGWNIAGPTLPQFHLLTYEDLHADARATLSELNRFLTGETPVDEILNRALEAGRFDVMKTREAAGFYSEKYGKALTLDAKNADNPDAFKTRQGKVGGWVEHFSAEDVKFCEMEMRAAGFPFGYGRE